MMEDLGFERIWNVLVVIVFMFIECGMCFAFKFVLVASCFNVGDV